MYNKFQMQLTLTQELVVSSSNLLCMHKIILVNNVFLGFTFIAAVVLVEHYLHAL